MPASRKPVPDPAALARPEVVRRVWLVDDSDLAIQASARILAPHYHVESFSDGAVALERAASGELPDVMVLDWHMPGVSGAEVLRFLRESPRTVGLPILVLTTTANGEDLHEALASGADDYVAKPSARVELVPRVGALLRTRELRERAERAEREIASVLLLERAARAEAEDANQAKDDFLATLAHELRTPLNAMLGWTQLLRGGTLTPELSRRALETVERNALAQASIIEDLLDVSRILSGKLHLELVVLDLAEAVTQCLETLRPAADAKKVALRLEIAHAAPVAADAPRLQQIVSNLVSNAIRFTRPGGAVTVHVGQEGARGIVRVADTGEGIALDVLPRIFERFQQGDSTHSRAHGGLGLGLAIVRHLTELHGGSASASSGGLGLGATFEVSLPASSVAPRRLPASSMASAVAQRLDGLVILIVDDDPDSLDLLRVALVARGALVAAAPSARAALAEMELRAHDVLVSDITMPEIDGYALIRTIRARDADAGGAIRAIALTAAARDEDHSLALAAGFQRHLSKPVDLERLVGAILRLAPILPIGEAA